MWLGHFEYTATDFNGVWFILILKESNDLYVHTIPDLHIYQLDIGYISSLTQDKAAIIRCCPLLTKISPSYICL